MKCWDAEIENRPTTKQLSQILTKWNDEIDDSDDGEDSEIYSQIKVCDEIGEKKFGSRSSKDKPKNFQTHPQAIYTSRLLNFKNLPKPVNSSDLSSFQFNSDTNTQSESANPISECLDVQLSELELNEIYQDNKNDIE
ncbi:kinase-like domain-containing protein [Rhizophagus irregularis DAOM 181602=DAOM 197198]|nr:kinase-like domain-containing protein [Rhizophagus irregularis DAOM 181602=DAOM 197198]